MPEGGGPSIANQQPKPRIVQYRNRRYSIRLEPVFWQALDRLAEREGQRLGRFVARLADRYHGSNFSSHLRVLCMLEAERALAEASLHATRANLIDLVAGSFSPGLVLSRYRTIVAYNDGFVEWLGVERAALHGADLTALLQLRTRRPLNDLWLDMLVGEIEAAEANVLYVAPGKVLAAPARLVALPAHQDEEFYAVLWVSPTRRTPPGPAPAGRG